jgi:chromate transporter
VHAWPLALPLASAGAAALPALAWTALKVGALSYGGGFVIVPLMQGDALSHDWLSQAQFANAVAYGQITPGPVTHTIALIGWGAAGLPGALLASAIAFAPSFAFVMLGGGRFEAVRSRPGPRAFLDGAGPAAIGAILGAAAVLAGSLEATWQWVVLALAAAGLALGRGPLLVLLAGAGAGVLITTIT